MEEIKEAEAFSRELDKILAGKATDAAPGSELEADLRFSAKLKTLDLSGESRRKKRVQEELLRKVSESRLRRLLKSVGVRPSVLAACAVLLIIAPIAFNWLAREEQQSPMMVASDTSLFGAGGNPHGTDTGQGFAPGASIGNGGVVVKPLNVRNPRNIDLNASRGPGGAGGKTIGESLGFLNGNAARRRLKSNFGGSGLRGAGGMYAPSPVAALSMAQMPLPVDREGYAYNPENPFEKVADHPLSTFSIDVDAASYSNTRRILNESRMPPADAVRIEEFINYFHYDYPEPSGEHPFSITTELAACPWNAKHKLVRVGIKGKSIAKQDLPPNNLVFLVDSSGSMMSADKLPLLKKGLRLLVEQLRKEDRISIVTYAGSAGVVLPSTSGADKRTILEALDRLEAGGSTAGGAGIGLAYQVAAQNFLKKGNNRVILATDGDFNVGVTSDGELTRMIEEKRESGVFLTVLGFGTGNVQDSKMEALADKGNGNYAYIDDVLEAQKVLVKEMGATLLTIAKDVKIQVEFNPARVQSYKLLGYENRMLKAEDFNNDKKDAGELGAGSTVTALYEVVPAGVADESLPSVDPLKYQKPAPAAPAPEAAESKELLTVKFRYKKPKENESRLISRPLADEDREWSQASTDFKFAASVAGFGMLLRDSKTKGDLDYDKVRVMAQEGLGKDEDGYRSEMVRLIAKAKLLTKQ